jgi:hypothetical protein
MKNISRKTRLEDTSGDELILRFIFEKLDVVYDKG